MGRAGLSVPARLALKDGLLNERTILDFGCGRGGDVRRLGALGLQINGWDPHYRPKPLPSSAEVVLCSYVLNVIESPHERLATLRRAYALTTRVLVVAVRGTHEARHLNGEDYADGTLTTRGTFHHLYTPGELRSWLKDALEVPVVPVEPGIAYVFREPADRASYLSRRYGGEVRPDEGGEVMKRLVRFLESHGREPTVDEQPQLCLDARDGYGRLGRALDVARREVDPARIEQAKAARHEDLMVVLALALFHGGPKLKDLPPDRVADLRLNYANLREALPAAEKYLMATGQMDNIRAAVRQSSVGKTSPSALYVHVDAVDHLPPLLRLYAACGAMVAGQPPDTTLIKLSHDRAGASFLTYPQFDRDPHPRLAESLTIDLPKLRGTWRDWRNQANRPLLHRKEEFVHASDPRHSRFRKLTRAEERAGLYEEIERIGREAGWLEVLAEKNVAHRGHRLIRVTE